jgi:hypothetical protein
MQVETRYAKEKLEGMEHEIVRQKAGAWCDERTEEANQVYAPKSARNDYLGNNDAKWKKGT